MKNVSLLCLGSAIFVVVVALMLTGSATADSACDATLVSEQIPLKNFASRFWRDFDDHTVRAAFYNLDIAQKTASAVAFASKYFVNDSRFIVTPGTDIQGLANLTQALVLLTFASGGENRVFGDDEITCTDRLTYQITRTSQAIARSFLFPSPAEVTLLGVQTLTISRENLSAPFKMLKMVNQLQASIVETSAGAQVWIPIAAAAKRGIKAVDQAVPGWVKVDAHPAATSAFTQFL